MVVGQQAKRGPGRALPRARAGLCAQRAMGSGRPLDLDEAVELKPEDTVLRICVTEQTFASGRRADGRVLAPDLYKSEHEPS